MEEILQDSLSAGKPIIACAVGLSENSMHPLKWAVDRVVTPGSSLYLIHVYPPLRHIPPTVKGAALDELKQKQRNDLAPDLKKFESYCRKKMVKPIISLVENDSIIKGLVSHINQLAITKLVIGQNPRSKLKSLTFTGPTKANLVMDQAPSFCTIMIIQRDKLILQDTNILSRSTSSSHSDRSTGYDMIGSRNNHSTLSVGHLDYSLEIEPCPGIINNNPVNSDPIVPGPSSVSPYVEPDTKNEIERVLEVEALQRELDDARREIKKQSARLESSEGTVLSFAKMNVEYEAQRREEVSLKEEALQKLALAEKLSAEQRKKLETMALALEDTKKEALMFQNHVTEEKNKQEEMTVAHEATKQEVEMLKTLLNEEKWKQEEMAAAHEITKEEVATLKDLVNEERNKKEEMEAAYHTTEQKVAMLTHRVNEENLKKEAIAVAHRATKQEARRLRNQVVEEKGRCEVVNAALEEARQQNATLLADLGKVQESLETERQLRNDVEWKVLEAARTQEALLKSQRRYTEYTFEELQAATDSFSEERKLGEGGYGCVYRGTIQCTDAAIKVLKQDGYQGHQEFQREVEILSRIHHPNIVMLLGACPEKACIVYECMENGSLEDRLARKHGSDPLPWYIRFRVCYEVALGLMFLHCSRPDPIIHLDLKPGNILLDRNFVGKISDIGVGRLIPKNMTFTVTRCRDTVPVGTFSYIDPDYQRTGMFGPYSDVYALGIIILQILTGKPAVGVTSIIENASEKDEFVSVLDMSAGDWPLEEAKKLALVGLQCAEPKRKDRMDLPTVLALLKDIAQVADAVATTVEAANECSSSSVTTTIVPSLYICPISQEVMKEPHIAADGFTYERECIETWLRNHNTSPMTNLNLEHKILTRNHSLRSAIYDWKSKAGTISE